MRAFYKNVMITHFFLLGMSLYEKCDVPDWLPKEMDVNEIWPSQDSISACFSTGVPVYKTIEELEKSEQVPARTSDAMPSIEIAVCNGMNIAVTGNRRLWAHQEFHRASGKKVNIKVKPMVWNIDKNKWNKRIALDTRLGHKEFDVNKMKDHKTVKVNFQSKKCGSRPDEIRQKHNTVIKRIENLSAKDKRSPLKGGEERSKQIDKKAALDQTEQNGTVGGNSNHMKHDTNTPISHDEVIERNAALSKTDQNATVEENANGMEDDTNTPISDDDDEEDYNIIWCGRLGDWGDRLGIKKDDIIDALWANDRDVDLDAALKAIRRDDDADTTLTIPDKLKQETEMSFDQFNHELANWVNPRLEYNQYQNPRVPIWAKLDRFKVNEVWEQIMMKWPSRDEIESVMQISNHELLGADITSTSTLAKSDCERMCRQIMKGSDAFDSWKLLFDFLDVDNSGDELPFKDIQYAMLAYWLMKYDGVPAHMLSDLTLATPDKSKQETEMSFNQFNHELANRVIDEDIPLRIAINKNPTLAAQDKLRFKKFNHEFADWVTAMHHKQNQDPAGNTSDELLSRVMTYYQGKIMLQKQQWAMNYYQVYTQHKQQWAMRKLPMRNPIDFGKKMIEQELNLRQAMYMQYKQQMAMHQLPMESFFETWLLRQVQEMRQREQMYMQQQRQQMYMQPQQQMYMQQQQQMYMQPQQQMYMQQQQQMYMQQQQQMYMQQQDHWYL